MALAAALAAACVLVLREPRSRALAMPVALALAAAAVGLLSASTIEDEIGARAGLLAVGGAVGLVFLLGLAVLFYRRPALVVLFTIFTLPFRIPVPTGADDTANLLLPLYVVIAAACVAHVWRALRGEPEAGEVQPEDPRMRRLTQALALVVVVYAVQALYSTDVEHAVKTLGFFYVPFAVSFRLLVEVRWTRRLLLQALGVVVGLALLFALVGLRRVGHRPAADLEREGPRRQRPQALLQGELAVLRPQRLRPLPRARDGGARRGAAVGAGAPRRHARGGGARAAVGGAGADAVGVELRGAARRARGAGRAALEDLAGGGRLRRDRRRGAGGGRAGAGRARPQDGLVLLRQRGVERPGEADPGRGADVRGPAADGLRLGVLRRPLPRPRARRVLAAVGRVAHHPGHDRGRAGGDRPRLLRASCCGPRSRSRSAACGGRCEGGRRE